MLLEQAMGIFADYLKLVQKSEKTIKNYMAQLEAFNLYICSLYNRPVYLEEVKGTDLEKYLFNKLGEEKYSSSHRDNMVTAFKSLFNFCVAKDYCRENVGKQVKHIKVETKERTYISEIEFTKIIRNMHNHTVRAVLQSIFYTGLRVSEAKNLKVSDVDFERETIFVRKGKGKKERLLPMNNKLKKLLLEYFKEYRVDKGTDNFFSCISGSISVIRIEEVLRETVREMGIEKHVTPHILRHSFASNLLERGVDLFRVQKLLGHEQMQTTSIYLHTSLAELERAVNKL